MFIFFECPQRKKTKHDGGDQKMKSRESRRKRKTKINNTGRVIDSETIEGQKVERLRSVTERGNHH